MTDTLIPVKNVARRPVDLEGGRVLAHGETGDAPEAPHTAALIDAGLLVRCDPAPEPVGEVARLTDLRVPELRDEAQRRGLTVPTNANKADLIGLIETHDSKGAGNGQ